VADRGRGGSFAGWTPSYGKLRLFGYFKETNMNFQHEKLRIIEDIVNSWNRPWKFGRASPSQGPVSTRFKRFVSTWWKVSGDEMSHIKDWEWCRARNILYSHVSIKYENDTVIWTIETIGLYCYYCTRRWYPLIRVITAASMRASYLALQNHVRTLWHCVHN